MRIENSSTGVNGTEGQGTLGRAEAKDHVGETATVCGKVVGTRYAASTRIGRRRCLADMLGLKPPVEPSAQFGMMVAH